MSRQSSGDVSRQRPLRHGSGAPGEGHDLLGLHRHIASTSTSTSKMVGELAPSHRRISGLPNDDEIVKALELELGAGTDPESVQQLLRDGDLTFPVTLIGWNRTGASYLRPVHGRSIANRCEPSRMSEPWTLLSERSGAAGYLPLTVRTFEQPDGGVAEWDIFGVADSVAVVAITSEMQVVLARQFRPGPGEVLDELPGGGVEPGEDVVTAGVRELLEETGYEGVPELAGSTWLAAGSRTRRHVVVVKDAREVAEPNPGPGEFCQVLLLPLQALRDHLRTGRLTDTDLGYLALDHLGLLG